MVMLARPRCLRPACCWASALASSFVAKEYGDPVADAATASKMRGLSLHGLMRTVLSSHGRRVPPGRFTDSDIRDVFDLERGIRASGPSTVSVSGILSNVANKLLLQSFMASAVVGPKFCRIGSDLSNFKAAKRYRMTGAGAFDELAPGGEIKHGSLVESEYDQKLSTFAKMLSLDRTQLINDDLGAFAAIPGIFGRKASIKLEKTIFETLLGNAGSPAFFSTDHDNYLSGAGSALALAGLADAEAAFATMLGSGRRSDVDRAADPARAAELGGDRAGAGRGRADDHYRHHGHRPAQCEFLRRKIRGRQQSLFGGEYRPGQRRRRLVVFAGGPGRFRGHRGGVPQRRADADNSRARKWTSTSWGWSSAVFGISAVALLEYRGGVLSAGS